MSLLTIWKPAPTATHTSPALASLLCFKSAFFNGSFVPSSYSNPGRLLWGEQYCTGCPVSTEQGEEISDDGYDPCVFAYLVHGSPHPVERSQRQVRSSRLPVVAGSVAGAVSEVAACCGAGCGGGSRFCAWRFQSAASICQWSRCCRMSASCSRKSATMASAVASCCLGGCSAPAVTRRRKGPVKLGRVNLPSAVVVARGGNLARFDVPQHGALVDAGGGGGGCQIIHGGCSLLLRGQQRGCTCMVKRSFARLRFRARRQRGATVIVVCLWRATMVSRAVAAGFRGCATLQATVVTATALTLV